MSSVGGIGGTGGAAGTGGVTGAGSVTGVGAVTSGSSEAESGSASKDAAAHGEGQPMCSFGDNMSTQSFVELHNTAITQVNEAQSSDIDLKKLIEMMIAIKLLKAMDEQ